MVIIVPSGFLCIDKPLGRTSRDITTIVHKHFKPTKAGHVGTLDPLATGLLVISIGNATRLSERLHELPKEYVGRFRLGLTSDTEDISGEVREAADARNDVTYDELAASLSDFIGAIEQVPPAYSAAKVNGRRAYDLARAGRSVQLAPKTVEILELELVDTPESGPVEDFGLRIRCGSGTYVRSLGRDLAAAVGSSAIMTELRRTHLGPFDLSMARPMDDLSPEIGLVDCDIAVGDLDKITLTAEQIVSVSHGNALRIARPTEAESFALLSPGGRLVAIAEPTHLGMQPRVVLKDAIAATI